MGRSFHCNFELLEHIPLNLLRPEPQDWSRLPMISPAFNDHMFIIPNKGRAHINLHINVKL